MLKRLQALVLAAILCGCKTSIDFRTLVSHTPPALDKGTCTPDVAKSRVGAMLKNSAGGDLHSQAAALLEAMNECVQPTSNSVSDCSYYYAYARLSDDRTDAEADNEALNLLKKAYDTYREELEAVSRELMKGIRLVQAQAPQNPMLFLLEARLYLLTGYALDNAHPLLGTHDDDAAADWYRKAAERAKKAQESSRSYGLAYLYEAESLARSGRCPDAAALLVKVHSAGYMTASTHAIMALCSLESQNYAKLQVDLQSSVEAAWPEPAATWSSQFKRFLSERRDWDARIGDATRKKATVMVMDELDPRFRDGMPVQHREHLRDRLECQVGSGQCRAGGR